MGVSGGVGGEEHLKLICAVRGARAQRISNMCIRGNYNAMSYLLLSLLLLEFGPSTHPNTKHHKYSIICQLSL